MQQLQLQLGSHAAQMVKVCRARRSKEKQQYMLDGSRAAGQECHDSSIKYCCVSTSKAASEGIAKC